MAGFPSRRWQAGAVDTRSFPDAVPANILQSVERESKEAEAREEEERLRLETMNLAVFCGDAKKVVGTRILDMDWSFRGNHIAFDVFCC